MLDALASGCWLVTADDAEVHCEAWMVPPLLPVAVGAADAAPVGAEGAFSCSVRSSDPFSILLSLSWSFACEEQGSDSFGTPESASSFPQEPKKGGFSKGGFRRHSQIFITLLFMYCMYCNMAPNVPTSEQPISLSIVSLSEFNMFQGLSRLLAASAL